MKLIITSLADIDFYKITMGQLIFHQFSNCYVEYEFFCRTKDVVWTTEMVNTINEQIDHLCTLQFSSYEIHYLKTINFLDEGYLDVLSLLKLNREHISIQLIDNQLKIKISGNWFLTTWYETLVLSIVNEVYYFYQDIKPDFKIGFNRLFEKISSVKEKPMEGFKFSEFGTRRRYSFDWQNKVLDTLTDCLSDRTLVGTSNVYFAMKFNIKPIGTMAHEIFMGVQSLVRLGDAQKYLLQKWAEEFRGDLGIALTDTYGTDAFLKDFDLYFAKLFDGLRHDSGNPFKWAHKVLNHLQRLGIDLKSKSLIFTDSLDFESARLIYTTFKDITNISFGIGTNLTNDFPNIKPLNIVIKMTKCNDKAVAKISDDSGKTMCNDEFFIKYLKKVYHVEY